MSNTERANEQPSRFGQFSGEALVATVTLFASAFLGATGYEPFGWALLTGAGVFAVRRVVTP